MASNLQIPSSAPVMVLPGCNFFPGNPLPLHIFEPRYRTMLALALEGERMFCIGTRIEPPVSGGEPLGVEVDEEADIYAHGTLGMVRACVRSDEGTSNLILEGMQRVRFRRWIRETPFRIAELEPVRTTMEDEFVVEEGIARLVALISIMVERGARKPPHLDLSFESNLDPVLMADIVAHYFIGDVETRQLLLSLGSLDQRLRVMAESLKAQLGTMEPP